MAVLTRVLSLMLLLCCFTGTAHARSVELAEQKIKAGMIYNFLKYADWPASDAAAPMKVCTLGPDPFDGSLKPMEGRSVNQRVITLRTIQAATDASSCHLLIFNGEDSQWPSVRTQLAGKAVMTLSDAKGFTQKGGMIMFGYEGSRITVTLNADAVAAAHIGVQQRLLNLVTVVHTGTGDGT